MIGADKTRVFGGQRVLAEKVIVGDKKSLLLEVKEHFFGNNSCFLRD
jgi:hypothetical protein